MAKSIKLSIKPTYDFDLVGIVTTEPIYRVAWLINNAMQISLTEASKLKIYNSKSSIIQDFSYFSQENDIGLMFELVSNKGAHGLLIEEQKHIDFFLKIYGEFVSSIDVIASLKGVKNISLALKIEPSSLKSKDRLLFTVSED